MKMPYLLLLFVLFVQTFAADNPYSDSLVLIKNLNLYVDGSFSGLNSAYLDVDIRVDYGNPLGSKLKRSNTTVKLYQDGFNRHRLNDVQILLENPLSFIRGNAILELTWFYNQSRDDAMQTEIFTLQIANWTEPLANEQSVNLTFNRPNWYLSMTYKKNCDRTDYFGFQCNVFCPKAATANECYDCNAATGDKKCCNDSDYDPFTCVRTGSNNGNGKPATCEDQLAQQKKDFNYQKKWKTVYFWIMIGIIVIVLILLAILICCLFLLLRYKKQSETQQQVHPVEDEWVEARSARSNRTAQTPQSYNSQYELYKQPNKPIRRQKPSDPPSPELHRRRPASVASMESDFRNSADYPIYPSSPGPRRRIEQLV